MLSRILVLIIGLAIGVVFVWQKKFFADTFGRNGWAERTFGPGGTFFMWQLIGIVIIVASLLYSTGVISNVGKKPVVQQAPIFTE